MDNLDKIYEGILKNGFDNLNEMEYDISFLDANDKGLWDGARDGIAVKAKNTEDAVKKAKADKGFMNQGAKKVRLAVVKGGVAKRIGTFKL